MGYDMYWHDRPADADPNEVYFGLNVWGMAETRDAMAFCDMAYDSLPDGDPPPCPEACVPGSGVHAEPCDDAMERWLASGVIERPGIAMHKLCSNDGWLVTPLECLGALAQWKKFVADLTDADAATLSDELTVAMSDRMGVDLPTHEWQAWLAYLRSAAEHGGFRVL